MVLCWYIVDQFDPPCPDGSDIAGEETLIIGTDMLKLAGKRERSTEIIAACFVVGVRYPEIGVLLVG